MTAGDLNSSVRTDPSAHFVARKEPAHNYHVTFGHIEIITTSLYFPECRVETILFFFLLLINGDLHFLLKKILLLQRIHDSVQPKVVQRAQSCIIFTSMKEHLFQYCHI